MENNNKQEFENLASMIKQGFDAVDARFEQVDKRFEQIDKRFEQIDQRFERVDARFESADKRFLGIESSLAFLEEGQEEIKSRLNNVAYRHELQNLEKRVDGLEKKLSTRPV